MASSQINEGCWERRGIKYQRKKVEEVKEGW